MKWIIICAIFFVGVQCDTDTDANDPNIPLPPGWNPCKRNQPDRNDCLRQTIQNLMKSLKDGYKPIGLDPLDPYFVDVVNFRYNSGNLNLQMVMKNVSTYGMSNTQIKGVRSQFTDDKMYLEIDVYHPQMVSESNYRGRGSFQDIKMKSQGYSNVTMTGLSAVWKVKGQVETINGEEYMKIKEFDTKPKIKSLKLYATGLFPDPDLNQFALEFLNQYWELFYEQVFPETKQIWEPIILNILNKIYDRYPYRRILPKE